ncbi:RNA methyltransferase [Bdellovibrio bacteriovorus]|nr:RNA methyltransferase [Bdellovibrio bacteriovorus]
MSEIKNDHKVPCAYKDLCNGCQFLDLTYGDQISGKIFELSELLKNAEIPYHGKIQFVSAGASHLRDRLDFSLEDGRLGLYRKDKKEITDLEICAQLSPTLQAWLTEFRTLKLPFKKASVRLRVGPNGERGVWLDLANIDIKALLDEKNMLHFLQQRSFVELGQRRKVPTWQGYEFKLKEPEARPWFQTWVNETAVPLFCQVASFTQPSHRANKLICNIIQSWVGKFPQGRVIEFGSGIGNLTIPALASCAHLTACEIDGLSLEGLEKTLERLPASLTSLREKIEIHRGDFQRKLLQDFANFDGALVNPPRSGLMGFLDPLEKMAAEKRPKFFIYMSCFPESMMTDLKRLKNVGYSVNDIKIVDQFPQTSHYEVLALLQRK